MREQSLTQGVWNSVKTVNGLHYRNANLTWWLGSKCQCQFINLSNTSTTQSLSFKSRMLACFTSSAVCLSLLLLNGFSFSDSVQMFLEITEIIAMVNLLFFRAMNKVPIYVPKRTFGTHFIVFLHLHHLWICLLLTLHFWRVYIWPNQLKWVCSRMSTFFISSM